MNGWWIRSIIVGAGAENSQVLIKLGSECFTLLLCTVALSCFDLSCFQMRLIWWIKSNNIPYFSEYNGPRRFRWPYGLRRTSAVALLLGSRVRICWGHGCSSVVFVVSCAGSGLCDELITRLEESHRLWCVWLCVIKKPQQWDGLSPSWILEP